jgi:hypothetical protein
MFVSGAGGDGVTHDGDISFSYRINLATGATTPLRFGLDTSLGGRSLAAASCSVVDTFFHNGAIQYHVSHDNGASFGPTVTVARADSADVAINPLTHDIVIAYEKDGNIFVSVYFGELICPPPPPPRPFQFRF